MTVWRAANSDFVRVLRDLLPRGRAWTRDPARRFSRLLQGLADELARVHNRAGDLVDEADPQTSTELLDDWERVTGLPECPLAAAETEADRRKAVAAKLSARGGQSPAYFEAIAQTLGVVADVLFPLPWRFVWGVQTPEVKRLRCNDPCGEPLVTLSPAGKRLRCFLERYKPAHTRIWWTD